MIANLLNDLSTYHSARNTCLPAARDPLPEKLFMAPGAWSPGGWGGARPWGLCSGEDGFDMGLSRGDGLMSCGGADQRGR